MLKEFRRVMSMSKKLFLELEKVMAMPNQVQLGYTFTAVEIKVSLTKKPVNEGGVASW